MTGSLPEWMVPKGASLRLEVDVTFLVAAVSRPWPDLPDGLTLSRVRHPTVALYRSLYEGVGHEYCWWMRQAMPDALLKFVIGRETQHVMVVRDQAGTILGFYELDLSDPRDGHLAYFGLMPQAMGRGLGKILLDCAVAHAFLSGVAQLRVNTCTQDHPAALPNYKRAGFEITHVEHEVWDIPAEYLPERLRSGLPETEAAAS